MINKLKGLFQQYIFEITILLMTMWLFSSEYNSNMNIYDIGFKILESFIIANFFMIIAKKMMIRCLSEEIGKVLHLSFRNEICMIPKKVKKDYFKYFLYDIRKIIKYAQEKKISVLYLKTHKILVKYFVKEYSISNYRILVEEIDKMKENEDYIVKTSFGEVRLKYIGYQVNTCNRYKTGIFSFFKFNSNLKEDKTYKLELHLN